jgi:hypothetical protein
VEEANIELKVLDILNNHYYINMGKDGDKKSAKKTTYKKTQPVRYLISIL